MYKLREIYGSTLDYNKLISSGVLSVSVIADQEPFKSEVVESQELVGMGTPQN